MQTVPVSALVLFALVYTMSLAAAQTPVGALAVDERQGDHYGWAVDYETAGAAQAAALRECGGGCRVVLTFERCAAYAADQDADSTAVGWSESFTSSSSAQQAALSECSSRGGADCTVRVWGCNGPVVEESLGLDRATRRQIQRSLETAGFDPGGADGLFGARTRAAIRRWQAARGSRATGYLDGAAVADLQPSASAERTARQQEQTDTAAETSAQAPATEPSNTPERQRPSTAVSAEQDNLFWESIRDSTNAADFEAYLAVFPNGVFRRLAKNRLAAMRPADDSSPESTEHPAAGADTPASGSRAAGVHQPGLGSATAADVFLKAGSTFRDCEVCPEMVVMPGGRLALGRYEVTVGEYAAFAAATGGGAGDCFGISWRNPRFPQTDRHPVTCVGWNDAQAYLSWLSQTTGATYRLPSEAEWARAAAGTQRGCDLDRTGTHGTCPVGSHGANGAGLSDMVGNLWEWTQDCWEGDCSRRVLRGGAWYRNAEDLRPDARYGSTASRERYYGEGFRVARTLD